MGITFEIDRNDIEAMCDLMCDNKLPKKKTQEEQYWIFTFGAGQPEEGHYVKIKGTFESARRTMFERYGNAWAFQYSEQEWIDWVARCPVCCPIETELEVID